MGRRFAAVLAAACSGAGCLVGSGATMLPWVFVQISPAGPVPKVAHAIAGVTPVAWYGALNGRRVLISGGVCRVRVASPSVERTGCVFRKPGRYA